jgi:hypothetical protein
MTNQSPGMATLYAFWAFAVCSRALWQYTVDRLLGVVWPDTRITHRAHHRMWRGDCRQSLRTIRTICLCHRLVTLGCRVFLHPTRIAHRGARDDTQIHTMSTDGYIATCVCMMCVNDGKDDDTERCFRSPSTMPCCEMRSGAMAQARAHGMCPTGVCSASNHSPPTTHLSWVAEPSLFCAFLHLPSAYYATPTCDLSLHVVFIRHCVMPPDIHIFDKACRCALYLRIARLPHTW